MHLSNEAIVKTKLVDLPVPKYALLSESFEISYIYYLYYRFLLILITIAARIRLGYWGDKFSSDPDNGKVEEIYHREAATYERKHHLTTNHRDTWWRRHVGMDLVTQWHNTYSSPRRLKLLDLATGIGLSVEEIVRVCRLSGVACDITALDYNEKMLVEARTSVLPRLNNGGGKGDSDISVEFVRGDARNLLRGEKGEDGLTRFRSDTFDVVSIMFGAGGIDNTQRMFEQILQILTPGGIFSMVDIHRPIKGLSERWPFYVRQVDSDAFAFMAWQRATMPLVLRALWGWRDPTSMFYTSPMTVAEACGKYWGFKLLSRKITNEPWWLGLPVMKTAHLVLEKEEITKQEFENRLKILDSISA